MTYLLIVFFTSFAALVAMIWHGKLEIEREQVVVSHRDAHTFFSVHEIVSEIQRWCNHIPRESILLFFHKSRERGMRVALNVLTRIEHLPIKKRIYSVIDAVRGRQKINTNGRPASPFIKNMLAHKEQFRNENNKTQ